MTNSINLINGDCIEEMAKIKDNSIDLILTDPPFGTTECKWDEIIPLDAMWEQLNRIAKNNTAIILFSQLSFTITLGASNLKNLKYEWIWEKDFGTGFLNAKKMPLKAHENILVFYKNLPTYNPQMRTGYKPYVSKQSSSSSVYNKQILVTTVNTDGTRYPLDVIKYNRAKKTVHPTQKPIDLLEYFIKTYSNAGDTVLDFTMGSGTTGCAAVNTGRNFIGIEKDKKYFEIAQKRIEEAQKRKCEFLEI